MSKWEKITPEHMDLNHARLALVRAGMLVEAATEEEIQEDLNTYAQGSLRLVLRSHCVVDAYTPENLSEGDLRALVRCIRVRERRYLRAGKVVTE